MSQADYIARYAKRQSLREAVETYWIDEPRSEFLGSPCIGIPAPPSRKQGVSDQGHAGKLKA